MRFSRRTTRSTGQAHFPEAYENLDENVENTAGVGRRAGLLFVLFTGIMLGGSGKSIAPLITLSGLFRILAGDEGEDHVVGQSSRRALLFSIPDETELQQSWESLAISLAVFLLDSRVATETNFEVMGTVSGGYCDVIEYFCIGDR